MANMPQLTTPSGAAISGYCFGTMQFGGNADKSESRAMYDAARGAGINFFDTAAGYTGGASETMLGEFAASERDKLFIATKCASTGDCRPASIAADFETSLQRLNMDAVDLLYMHRWSDEVPLEATYEVLAGLVQSGRVRHIGVSNYAAWQVMKAQNVAQTLGGGLLTGKYAGGQGGRLLDDPMYKARYGQDWMHTAATALAEVAADLGVSPITLAVAWVAHNPGITAPIISARSADQLQPSLAAIGFDMNTELYGMLSALTPTPPPATDRLEEA